MNLLILEEADFIAQNTACITGRRAVHLITILKKKPGEQVDAGLLNGKVGKATILSTDGNAINLAITLSENPPAPNNLSLILALPRPLMFKRILQAITSFGVKNIHILQSAGVEKSYWQSHDLDAAVIHEQLILGLEQSRDTLLPTVSFHRDFEVFFNGELPSIMAGKQCFVAHPGNYPVCPSNISAPVVLAIGPESGFTETEISRFIKAEFAPVQAGSRILRVETAVSALLGRMLALSY